MVSDTELAAGIAVLIRDRASLHWPEIKPHAETIAATLVQMMHRGESKVSLIPYVATELHGLDSFSSGMAEAIVEDALRLDQTNR
jgi:hypothetical protein